MAAETKVLEKVGKLLKLANDGGGESEEARSSAIQAVKLMKEHELVLVPKSEIDRVSKLIEGANSLARQQKGEATQKLILGAVAGVLLAKQLKL
jgi:hypothetical protein